MVITHRTISIILMILGGEDGVSERFSSANTTLHRCSNTQRDALPSVSFPTASHTHTHAHMGALSLTLSVALTLSFERKLNNYPAGAERAQGNPLGRVNGVFARVKEAVSGRRAV